MNACQVGHEKHETLTVAINLYGRALPDLPYFGDNVAHKMKFKVYDAGPYEGIPNYCTGNDELSRAILHCGVWEAFETALILDILKNEQQGMVLDFGAHIGWYSIIAALHGHDIKAFEGDVENVEMLIANARLNECDNRIQATHCWIDAHMEPLPLSQVLLMKSDLEGKDAEAVRVCQALFEAKRIKYALIEISPVLAAGYPELVEQIAGYGYGVYQVPSKGFEHIKEYETAPLETLVKYCEVPAEGRAGYVAGLRQENLLFIKH